MSAMLTPYRRALSVPGALRFSLSGAVARMPMAMTALGLVILVEDRTGSYGAAGAVSASYVAANALGGIPLARLVDRYGQSRVLRPAVLASVLALGVVVLLVERGAGWPLTHLVAALAGGTMPNVGAAVRARWSHVLRREGRGTADRSVLDTAFSLEAVNDELVFILGPTLTTLLSAGVHPWAGLLAAVAAALTGTWSLVSQRDTEPPAQPPTPHRVGPPMPWGTLVPLMLSALCLGLVLGSCEVATIAVADAQGRQAIGGVLLAIWSLGSLLAGATVGAMTLRRSPAVRYRLGSFSLALLLLPLPFAEGLSMVALFLFLSGLAIAPTLIAAVGWVERAVPAERLNEGIAAATAGLVAGVAPGAALAGYVVDAAGAGAAYWVSVAVAVVGFGAGFLATAPQRVRPGPAGSALSA